VRVAPLLAVSALLCLLAAAPAHAARHGGCDPGRRDTDGDGMPDRFELRHGLACDRANGARDADGDGLSNLREFHGHTDPRLADSDADGLGDGAEVGNSLTDPRDPDSDSDGVLDGDVLHVRSDPALFPAFDPSVSDYVVRCGTGVPTRVWIAPARRAKVAFDGGAARAKPFARSVRLASGQGLSFATVRGRHGRRYHLRCLPSDFPGWTVERHGTPQAQGYVVIPSRLFAAPPGGPYVTVFDGNGVPVWWVLAPHAKNDGKLLPNGDIAWVDGTGGIDPDSPMSFAEHTLDGPLVRTTYSAGLLTDPHDFQLLANGDYLVGAYSPRDGVDLTPYGGPSDATVLDAVVQELRPDHSLVWSWSSKDHIALSETGRWWAQVLHAPGELPDGRMAYDIVHLNSVELTNGRLLISARALDAVYEIDAASGAIRWKLGGTSTGDSLAIAGDPEAGTEFGGQHDARLLPDGSVTVFDNSTDRDRPPRAMRFAVDPAAGTGTLLERISDPSVSRSFCCGSARRLPGGHWVVAWGDNPLFSETTASGRSVLRLAFADPTAMTYRAEPILPGQIRQAALRAGMDAMHPRPGRAP
jgi:Arylsulfotransferase (ASST)